MWHPYGRLLYLEHERPGSNPSSSTQEGHHHRLTTMLTSDTLAQLPQGAANPRGLHPSFRQITSLEQPDKAPTPRQKGGIQQQKKADAIKIQFNLSKKSEVLDFSRCKYTPPISVVNNSLRTTARVSVRSAPAQEATNG